jgi:hypothetical protein
MKRKLIILITAFMLFGITAKAETVGEVIGKVYPTDIVTDICGYKAPAYNIGGETAVLVSDLSNYGFDVKFENGIVYADYNWQKEKTPISTQAKTDISVLYTDIKVKLNGIEVPSYNIDGSMAIPIERTCDAYLETNKENEISPFSLNYVWCEEDKTLSLDISDDRISYQDFMIDLIKAAHMDFDSNFYNHYVKTDDEENSNEKYIEKFSDIKNTKLAEYINLLVKADLVDTWNYEEGGKLYPYRGVTRTDAAFLISRILGCPADYTEAMKYYDNEYSQYGGLENYNEELVPNYNNYSISSYDAYKIPEWAKPYFAYLLDINVLTADANNYLCPNDFLTQESEKELIDSMLNYMEKGITDKKVNFSINSSSVDFKKDLKTIHSLTSSAQIVDGILYVPLYSMFNKTYREQFENNIYSDAMKPNVSKETGMQIQGGEYTCIFSNQYLFTGDWGVIYNVFPGINAYVEKHFSRASAGVFIPELIKLDYPIRKLYGEPMIPVYNYNTNTQIKNFDSEFNVETNTLTFTYARAYFSGS